MKKHLFILGFAMLLSAASAFAQDCDYSGTTGTLEWCLKDGTLTISGEGAMPDYDEALGSDPAPWYTYRRTITTIVI
ncbi:MAG: leucine-rich repeat domain-containing protein, partial [Bacteroidales bacterium]|nr:leucine-rich repeat domain-containing protein [Bacteroidales bacterium]